MKKKSLACILGFCLIFLCFQIRTQVANDQISENFTKLLEGIDLLPQSGPEQVREFILILCDSILQIAPQIDIPQNIQSEIKESLKAYRNTKNVMLAEDSIKSLWKAGRFLDPNFDLNFPDNATPEIIKEDVKMELNQAQAFHGQGKMDRVEEILLRTVLRIVTPVIH